MQFRIKKGKHRAKPVRLWLWINKTVIRRLVSFDFSCKYDLKNQQINKLFGIGYLWGLRKESARFGWRYNNDKRLFTITAYCHVKGQLITRDICDVVASKNYIMEIKVNPGYYDFIVSVADSNYQLARYSIPKWHKLRWSYPMGIYFGGHLKAPHSMAINMKKI